MIKKAEFSGFFYCSKLNYLYNSSSENIINYTENKHNEKERKTKKW